MKHNRAAIKGKIMNVLGKYSDVFTDVSGKTNLIKHRVELTENESFRNHLKIKLVLYIAGGDCQEEGWIQLYLRRLP